MKKIIICYITILTIALGASERSVIDLQKQGQAAIRAKNFDQAQEIIRKLRSQPLQRGQRQANDLQNMLNRAMRGEAAPAPAPAEDLREVGRLQREAAGLRAEIEEMIRRGGRTKTELAELRREYEQRLKELRDALDKSQKELHEQLKEANVSDDTIKGLRESIDGYFMENQKLQIDNMNLLNEVADLKRQLEELRQRLEAQDQTGAIAKLRETIANLEKDNATLKIENSSLRDVMAANEKKCKEDLQRSEVTIESLRAEVTRLINEGAQGGQECIRENEALKEKSELQIKEIKRLQTYNDNLLKENDELKAKGGAGQECIVLKQENVALRNSLEEYKKTDIAGLKSELTRCGDVTLQLTTEKNTLKTDNDQKQNTIDAQQQLIKSLQEEFKAAQESNENTIKRVVALEEELSNIRSTIADKDAEIAQLRERIAGR